ncbi:MAG: chemotaxis protein CheX [Ruminiclostridium sp.]|nr:chemotaxis protein CheX [Ruminiclostridium sp.]
MYTQLFGHYLLNNGIIDADELHAALTALTRIKVKLGSAAIDAGYMSAEQVEEIHELQHTMDKRFGELAIEQGYLTDEQARSLLSKQKNSNLLLGQALIDFGFITNKQFEDALNDYKRKASLINGDSEEERMENEMIDVLGISDMPDKEFYSEYILLFIRNLIRFLGDDFSLSGVSRNVTVSMNYACTQEITGPISATVAIGGTEHGFIGIGARYSGEELHETDGYTKACVGELLNLQNGLFAVNASNSRNIELDLKPQESFEKYMLNVPENGICVGLSFSFGDIKIAVIKHGERTAANDRNTEIQ